MEEALSSQMMLALRDGAIAEYDALLTRHGAETKLDNAA